MKLSRPKPVIAERSNGRAYRLQPPTRGQVQAAMELEETMSGETVDQLGRRISAQLAALGAGSSPEVDPVTGNEIAGAPALPLAELTGEEEREILTALIAMHEGLNPSRALSVSQALKKNAILGVLASVEADSSSGSSATA